ncbi:MAG: hypothetical protein V3W41_21275 [Planctomycetota bacterium]
MHAEKKSNEAATKAHKSRKSRKSPPDKTSKNVHFVAGGDPKNRKPGGSGEGLTESNRGAGGVPEGAGNQQGTLSDFRAPMNGEVLLERAVKGVAKRFPNVSHSTAAVLANAIVRRSRQHRDQNYAPGTIDSIETLATEADLTPGTVRRTIPALVAAGFQRFEVPYDLVPRQGGEKTSRPKRRALFVPPQIATVTRPDGSQFKRLVSPNIHAEASYRVLNPSRSNKAVRKPGDYLDFPTARLTPTIPKAARDFERPINEPFKPSKSDFERPRNGPDVLEEDSKALRGLAEPSGSPLSAEASTTPQPCGKEGEAADASASSEGKSFRVKAKPAAGATEMPRLAEKPAKSPPSRPRSSAAKAKGESPRDSIQSGSKAVAGRSGAQKRSGKKRGKLKTPADPRAKAPNCNTFLTAFVDQRRRLRPDLPEITPLGNAKDRGQAKLLLEGCGGWKGLIDLASHFGVDSWEAVDEFLAIIEDPSGCDWKTGKAVAAIRDAGYPVETIQSEGNRRTLLVAVQARLAERKRRKDESDKINREMREADERAATFQPEESRHSDAEIDEVVARLNAKHSRSTETVTDLYLRQEAGAVA